MNILVTGGTGFLGRHLVPHLEKKGHKVYVVNSRNGDLRKSHNLLVFNALLDRIYHLACWTKAGDFCLHHQGEQWITNQQINTNVLRYWREHQPQALMITMGTSCAYPLGEKALKEEDYMVGEPDPNLATYAYTKRMLYVGLLALQKQFGMKFQNLIPSTLYGPGFEVGDNHFIFDLIKKIHAGKTRGEEVVLWGTGEQVRELMFVDDAVRLIELAAGLPKSELLNLGSGAGYTIRQYAEMLCEIIGYDPEEIRYDPTKYSGNPKRFFDTSKVKRLFPDFSFTDIREGLKKTVAYYQTII